MVNLILSPTYITFSSHKFVIIISKTVVKVDDKQVTRTEIGNICVKQRRKIIEILLKYGWLVNLFNRQQTRIFD